MCQGCRQLQDDLEQTQGLLEKAGGELVGAYETLKAQGKELARLRRELSTETSPLAQDVRRVLEFWQEKHPKATIPPDGARAKIVRGAMRLGHTNPPLPCPQHDTPTNGGKRDKDARCTVADELIEALEGLRLLPFTGPKGRTAVAGPGTKRWDDIQYALTEKTPAGRVPSESMIETFRSYARWAKFSSSEKLFVRYEATGAVYEAWTAQLMDAIARETRWSKLEASENGNGAHA